MASPLVICSENFERQRRRHRDEQTKTSEKSTEVVIFYGVVPMLTFFQIFSSSESNLRIRRIVVRRVARKGHPLRAQSPSRRTAGTNTARRAAITPAGPSVLHLNTNTLR